MRLSRAARGTAGLLAAAVAAFACDNSSGPGITLDVTPDSIQLVRNDSVRLSVTALDGDGRLVTGVSVTFESADTTIVTVTNLGLVRARAKLGRTTVGVNGGGAHRTIPVIVYVPPAFIVVGPSDTLIARGATVQMSASAFDANNLPITDVTPTWESTAPAMVSVSATGLARGDSAGGEALIVARLGAVSGNARVRVRGPTSIVVTPADTTVSQGDSVQFRARVFDQVGDSIPGLALTWESSDTLVATVSTTGKARTASGTGPALIRARYGSVVGEGRLFVRDTTILGQRVMVGGAPYGASISATGVVYVTLPQRNQLARTDLPNRSFAGRVSVGSIPTEVSFNYAGTRAYVTNQFNQNIGVVNVATNSQIDVIPVTGDPFEIFVAPGDSVLYVATNVNQVYAIRIATKEVITQFATGGGVGNEMVIRNDTLLYVSTHHAGTVIEWNLRTRAVSRTFTVGGTAQKMALSADQNTLYIANEAGYVSVWNLTTGTQDGANILIPGGAYGLSRRPTTGMLYVTNASFGGGDIFVVNPATRQIINAVAAGGSTRDVVFASDGTGFVPNEAGWVDFIK